MDLRPFIFDHHLQTATIRFSGDSADWIVPAPIVTGFNPADPARPCRRQRGLPSYLLWFTTHGQVNLKVDGGDDWISSAGEAVLIEPHRAHVYGCRGGQTPWTSYWVIFEPRPHWSAYMDWPQVMPGVACYRPPDDTSQGALEARFRELHETAQRGEDGTAWAMHHLEGILLEVAHGFTTSLRSQELPPALHKVLELMAEGIDQPLNAERLAEVGKVSVPHLNRLFRQHLQTSPQRYVEQLRLKRACELLRSTMMRVQEVATVCGFEHPFYFTRRFKAMCGCSPRDYRRSWLDRS